MASFPAIDCEDSKLPGEHGVAAGPEGSPEDAYRLLLDANPEPMWIFDVDTLRFLAVNDAAFSKYGYSREEFLCMTVADIRPAEDVPRFLEHHAESMGAKLRNAGVWKHRTKSGRILVVEILSSRLIFQGRNAELIVAKDITAEKRMETAMSVRYALTSLLAESPADDYSQILECLCTRLGFDVGEVWQSAGQEWFVLEQLWHGPALPDSLFEQLQPGFRNRTQPDSSLVRLADSGSPIWYANLNQISEAHRAVLLQAGMRSGVGFPIRTNAATHGAVVLFRHCQVPPDEYEFELLTSVISQVGQHIERHRAQRRLLRAEEAFRKLFDEAPVPYHEIDRNGIVTRVNRAECDLLGLPPAEMIGRPVWEFVAAEQQEESRAAVARKLAGEQPVGCFERKYRGRDGATVDVEIHECLITDDKGRVTGMRTAMLDLSAHKQAQGRIEYQARLLDNVADVIFGLDNNFRVTYMNHAAEQRFGWNRDEALGQDLAKVAPARIDEQTRNRYHQEALSQGHWNGELVYLTSRGQRITTEASGAAYYGPDGSRQGGVLVLRDISERKRAEEALRASEARLKLVQGTAKIGVWDWVAPGEVVQCSDEILAIYGLPPGTETTMSLWQQLLHPDDREMASRTLLRTLETGESFSIEFRVIRPDGSIRWVLGRGGILVDEQSGTQHLIGVNLDITEHKLVEDRLRILSRAVEQSPVSIVITDLKGNIEYANPKTTQVTGYDLDEIKGKNSKIFKSGETPSEEYRDLWQTIPHGEWRGIFHNRKKDGALFWEAATIGPIRDAQGKPTHYLAIKEDITAQREMEQALRFTEERFRIAAKNTADLIYDLDLRTNRAQAFGAVERCLGGETAAKPTTYEDFQRLLHPDDREPVMRSIGQHIVSGEPFHAEYRVAPGNGTVRYWQDHGQSLLDEKGKPYRWIGVINDVTERKLAERANAELAAIVAGADAAIVGKDLAGSILSWNPGAERIYGYPAAEMLGCNMSVLVPEDRRAEQSGILSAIAGSHQVSHLETVRVKRGGARIDVLISVSPMRDSSGRITGASDIAWDITEFKHLQRQLAQSQKLESIGQLAAGIAHEINTPIQYIGDNATFLEEAFGDLFQVIDTAPDPGSRPEVDVDYLKQEIPKSIHELLDGVNHVARIVRAMKEFSHPGPAEKMLADLNRGIESTIVVSKNEWKYVAEVIADLDPELPPVLCIAGELNQVVLNLIVNAAHAIAEANQGTERKGKITITTRHDDRVAEIRVSDTGTGIPEEIRPRIFDLFFTTKEVGKGTGQGLAIAHTVITQTHHGSITFETQMGVGTTFIIRLPLTAGGAAQ